jgi:5'-methylthioadenosine phosphorylase
MACQIGIIGGSGLYDMAELVDREAITVQTPFGEPSGPYVMGTLRGRRVAFLARHGAGHRILPSELNFRANIFGFKLLGAERILSASAVGSLREDYKPQDIVIPDQFFDRTRGRISTFFGGGLVAHVGFAHPVCAELAGVAVEAARAAGARVHDRGTYVCMEGPAFSTRAESELHRSWKASLIGMTALPEARLAREAEICYATIAMVTDYDCWKETGESVSVEMVVATMKSNTEALKRMLPDLISSLRDRGDCHCRHAARDAIMTDPALIPYDVRRRLALFYDRYWRKDQGVRS